MTGRHEQASGTQTSESAAARLRLLAIGFAMIVALAGIALTIAGVRGLRDTTSGSILTILVGVAVVAYAVRLAARARRRDFPAWIRDLLHSLPL